MRKAHLSLLDSNREISGCLECCVFCAVCCVTAQQISEAEAAAPSQLENSTWLPSRVGAGSLNKQPRLGNQQKPDKKNKDGMVRHPTGSLLHSGALEVNCAAPRRCTEDLQAVTWHDPEHQPGACQDSAGGIPNVCRSGKLCRGLGRDFVKV